MAPGTFGKVYMQEGSFRGAKCLIVGKYVGLDLECVGTEIGKDSKSPAFLAKFPLGKLPAFEGSDGFLLSDSSAICQYLCAKAKKDHNLLSKDNPKENAEIMKWVFFAESDMIYILYAVVLPLFGVVSKVDHSDKKTAGMLKSALDALEFTLKNGKSKYLVNDNVTLADIHMFCTFNVFYKSLFTESVVKKYPGLDAWYKSLCADPVISSVFTKGYELSTNKLPSDVASALGCL